MITINVNTSSNSPKLKKKLEKAVNKILEAERDKDNKVGYSVTTEFTSTALRPHYGVRRPYQPEN